MKALRNLSVTDPCNDMDAPDTDDEENDEESSDGSQSLSTDINNALIATWRLHRLPCIAHSMQLMVRAVDKHKNFSTIVSKVRNIVHSILVSSVATKKLINKWGKTVVSDCPTRWSSTLQMLKRLLECNASVMAIFDEHS